METLKLIISLFRIRQWVKNTFIFFPLLFSGRLFHPDLLQAAIIAFAGFCFVSSGVYILNDLMDRGADRIHPRKARRPLVRTEVNAAAIVCLIIVVLGAG